MHHDVRLNASVSAGFSTAFDDDVLPLCAGFFIELFMIFQEFKALKASYARLL